MYFRNKRCELESNEKMQVYKNATMYKAMQNSTKVFKNNKNKIVCGLKLICRSQETKQIKMP